MSIAQQLMDMGFPADKAEAAAGNNRNLDQALDWIEKDGAGVPMETDAPAQAAPGAADSGAPPVAASFKCDDCGKLLANDDAIMFHASKTKHENFSESSEAIKPLTAEEKAAKVLEIREKIKVHQAKKAKLEAEENREKEKKRREDGKAMISHKEAARDREIREAAQDRRREKNEDEIARKRVLEQIRLDKEARKAKASGQPVPEAKPAPSAAPVAPPKDYSTTTLQFRLLDGQTVRQQFEANEPLAMVRAWVETNHANGVPFTLMTPFPRKVFTEDDMGTPLKVLNLVPSANVILNRAA
ncbi:UBX domain-containing protein 1 [Caenorhabditis elegans]|uniref:UBX domain-containing protein 1 n=1 Tax=Caenorhabditis elegans TaxID=6239 RepID=UBXN1_CAEEL|nr:UBX domain-containing protein 1 [Caenorhabditis elegans]Q9TXH9.1 RecName: Full=UBX domain-containing protein 1 [Caenorhabditis elegans]CCD69888.1 UBX domain-containing protein 1 [Caenorhabditis elegans]|eukprot:NP_490978.1 UBX domain-containing protein 1 [Caenorhabditis elegans]